jgi:ribonuclease HI
VPVGQLLLLVDGTPRAGRPGVAGVGVVACTPRGQVLAWHCAEAPAQTSMEAEYQAVIAGLEFVLRRYGGAQVRCLSDNRVVVEQLNGRYAVRAARLKPLHAQAAALARQIGQIEFLAIPRALNDLADALAGLQLAQDRVVGLLDRNKDMNG